MTAPSMTMGTTASLPEASVVQMPIATPSVVATVAVRQATLSAPPVAASVSDASTVTQRVEKLAHRILEAVPDTASKEIQEALANLLNLLPELSKSGSELLMTQAEIATKALLSEPPSLALGQAIEQQLSKRLHNRVGLFRGLFSSGSPSTRVVLGLGTLLYCAVPVFAFLLISVSNVPATLLGVSTALLGLVAFAGALGSIVSIMVRMHDFAALRDVDPAVLFFTGFFKPVVGTAFALFVFATLNSGLLPLTIDPTKSQYFFAALAFVSGFSERFASDVASRAEKTVLLVRDVGA